MRQSTDQDGSSRICIALYGRLQELDRDTIEETRQKSRRRKPGRQRDEPPMPQRRCSAEVDWTSGQRSRAILSPRHRLELKQAVQAYDTAHTQFARLYRAMHDHMTTRNNGTTSWRFIPEVEHVHIAYTATMQSYVRLCVMERAHWDEKSACLEMESLYSAFRTFVGSSFRAAAGWPVDFEAKVPSMDGYFEALERQYRLKAYGESIGRCAVAEEDVEDVSDFEDALLQANAEGTQGRGDPGRRAVVRPIGNTRRRGTKRQMATSQAYQAVRRRGT